MLGIGTNEGLRGLVRLSHPLLLYVGFVAPFTRATQRTSSFMKVQRLLTRQLTPGRSSGTASSVGFQHAYGYVYLPGIRSNLLGSCAVYWSGVVSAACFLLLVG